jgi:hypothetical protein
VASACKLTASASQRQLVGSGGHLSKDFRSVVMIQRAQRELDSAVGSSRARGFAADRCGADTQITWRWGFDVWRAVNWMALG